MGRTVPGGGKGRVAIWLKLSVGGAIFLYLLLTLDLSHVAAAFRQASPRFLAAGLVFVVAIRFLLAWQTALALKYCGMAITTARVFVVNTIVGFYLIFLPTFTGGVIKWHRFSASDGKGFEVLAGLLFIKVLNLALIALIGLGAISLFSSSAPWVSYRLLVLIAAGGAGAVFARKPLSSLLFSASFKSLHARFPHVAAGDWHRVRQALAALGAIPARGMIGLAVFPLLIQGVLTGLFMMVALSLGHHLPVPVLVWISAAVILIQHIPLSVSGLGLREGALVLVLPRYGLSQPEAMAFSMILMGYALVMAAVGGVLEAREQLMPGSARLDNGEGQSEDKR